MDKIKPLYAINVFGVMAVWQAFIPFLVEASKAHTSLAAICPTPFYSAYNSSEAAMFQYGNTVRVELESFGIQIVTIV